MKLPIKRKHKEGVRQRSTNCISDLHSDISLEKSNILRLLKVQQYLILETGFDYFLNTFLNTFLYILINILINSWNFRY